MENRTAITVKLDRKLLADAQDAAWANRTSISEVVRQALARLVASTPKRRRKAGAS